MALALNARAEETKMKQKSWFFSIVISTFLSVISDCSCINV